MPDGRFRRRAHEAEYGPTCIDCAGPKAANATRCRPCWRDNVLRANPRYWGSRTCGCGGPKGRQSPRCLRCTNQLKIGKPRRGQIVGGHVDHPWRRERLSGKAQTA